MVLSPKSSVKLLADPSRFEKREVQLTVYYHTGAQCTWFQFQAGTY